MLTSIWIELPRAHQAASANNLLERIMREIRRRTPVVGAFPDGQSCLNLAAARLRYIVGTAVNQMQTQRGLRFDRPYLTFHIGRRSHSSLDGKTRSSLLHPAATPLGSLRSTYRRGKTVQTTETTYLWCAPARCGGEQSDVYPARAAPKKILLNASTNLAPIIARV